MSVIPLVLSILALVSSTICQKSHQKSLVIVFDGTGSMGNNLAELVPAANSIIEDYAARPDKPIYNYILTVFHDPTIDPTINSQDPNDLKVGLSKIVLHNNGDQWSGEKSITGLKQSLEHALQNSIVFLITDDEGNDYAMEPEVVAILQKKQITVYVLLAEKCFTFETPGCKVYDNISRLSNGLIFYMDSTNIQKVLKNLERNIDPNHVPLTTFIKEAAGIAEESVSVDRTIQEICASVSGKNPTISVFGPNKEKVKLISEFAMERYRFGCIENPNSGLYEFKIEASSGFVAKIDARSSLKLLYGFSIEPVGAHSETNVLPLVGHKNILTIFPSDSTLIQTLSDVFIQTGLHHRTPIETKMILKKVNDGAFATESFELPNEAFKIRLRGLDSLGVPIDRIISASLVSESGSAPEVSIETTEISLCTNEEFLLKCKVKSQIPVKVQWTFNGRLEREVSANQSKELTLELDNFDTSRKGIYKCVATNKIASHSKEMSVNIFKVPKVKMVTTTTELTEFLDYQLKCDITDTETNPEIKWIDEDGKILSQGSSTYSFIPTRKYDGKQISCQVANNKCSVKDSKIFLIKYVPLFKDQTLPKVVQKSLKFGDKMNFDCESDRNPIRHKIQWFLHTFENKTIEQVELANLDKIEFSATKATDGVFECVIANDLEPVKRQFNVTVSALAPPKVTTPSKTFTFNETDKAELICECSECLPITKATWLYENSSNIEVSPNADANSNKYQSILHIHKVDRSNGGKFKCKLENNLGSDEGEVELVVQTAPKIENITWRVDSEVKKVDKIADILEGKDVEFTMVVDGFPAPELYWMFNDEKIASGNLLKLKNISSEHEGIYECVSENIVSKSVKQFKISLNFPPKKNVSDIQQLQFNLGTTASINCEIFGNPKPEIKWKFKGNEIYARLKYSLRNDDNTLVFDAKEDDDGIYTCVGTNEHGTTSMDFKVAVKTLPTFLKPLDDVFTIKKGSTLEISCETSSIPSPTIRIIKKDSVISSSIKFIKEDIQMTDAGVYQCVAENKVGISVKSFNVTVVEPPRITTNFRNISLANEENVQVSCEATGVPKPSISWWFAESTLISESEILNLTTSHDRGFYECVAENSEDKDRKSFYADIRKLNPYKNISEIQKELTVKENDNFELLCPYKNYETLKWTFNGEKIRNYSNFDFFDSKLIVKTIKRTHDGVFSCEVTDPRDKFNFNYKVEVLAVPFIKVIWEKNNETIDYPQSLDFMEHQFKLGDKMKISCEANGNPKPTVTWFKSNLEIFNGKMLVDEDLSHESSGVYSCVAKNSQGESKKFFTITVAAAPHRQDNQTKLFEVSVGEALQLECDVRASPPPTYVWFKDSKELDATKDRILVIKNVKIDDDGIYKCLAINNYGTTSQEFKVSVLERPTILEPAVKLITFKPSTFITLSCVARGNPIPQFSWGGKQVRGMTKENYLEVEKSLKDAKELYFNDKGDMSTVESPQHNSKLTKIDKHIYKFETTIKFMAGMVNVDFSCITKSHLGADVKFVRIQMNEKPLNANKKKVETFNQIYEVGQKIALECPLTGRPAPTYNWLKNGKSLEQQTNKIFQVDKADESHSGFYTCVGKNEEGSARTNFDVTVESKPGFSSTDTKSTNEVENFDVLRGSDATLKCKMNANPPPQYSWEEVVKGINQKVNNKKDSHISRNVRQQQKFVCTAKNKRGSVQKTFVINPVYAPEFVEPALIKPIVVSEDGKFELNCKHEANPKGEIKWFKDFTEISKSEVTLTSSDQMLEIRKAKLSDNGIFSCIVKNQHGAAQKNFSVTVNPTIIYHPWSNWTECRHACDVEENQHRIRHCVVRSNISLTHSCENVYEVRKCEKVCWSNWSNWLECPPCKVRPEDKVKQIRTRKCVAKSMNECKGGNIDDRECDIPICAENYGWSEWSEWRGECPSCQSKNDPKSYQQRERSCQVRFDNICKRKQTERRECEISTCREEDEINTEWSDWGPWDKECPPCKKTTDELVYRTRSRSCLLTYGTCKGEYYDFDECNIEICPEEVAWGEWSQWTKCPVCQVSGRPVSKITRTRKCSSNFNTCPGHSVEERDCQVDICVTYNGWTEWGVWSKCSRKCGTGSQKRHRLCTIGRGKCVGAETETTTCKIKNCGDYK